MTRDRRGVNCVNAARLYLDLSRHDGVDHELVQQLREAIVVG